MYLLKLKFRLVYIVMVMLLHITTVVAQSEFPPKANWDTAYINKVLMANTPTKI